jgi:hypothetical protein
VSRTGRYTPVSTLTARLCERRAPRAVATLSSTARVVASRDTGTWVVKPIHQRWGGSRLVNVEAEWIAWQLFRRARVLSPPVTVIDWPGAHGPQIATPYLPDAGHAWDRRNRLLSCVDARAVCRLLVVDAIIGNVDRHLGNVLLARPPCARGSAPIAIDHGLSMVTEGVAPDEPLLQNLTPGFDGLQAPPDATRWETLVAERSGTLPRLWRCRDLLQIAASLGPAAVQAQATSVRRSVSDRFIASAVRAVPDEVIFERPAGPRTSELEARLRARRALLRPENVVDHIVTAVGFPRIRNSRQ